MIEYEKFIYLDVYKTGSTHIASTLKKIVPEKPVKWIRHAPVTAGHPIRRKCGKLVFATVRNPWDWYVSMWAYGHTKENPLYRHILESLGPERHAELYDTENPKISFPLWLKSINDPDFLKSILGGHQLSNSGLANHIGFYTYRFLRVTTGYPRLFLRGWNIGSVDDAIAHQRKWAMYDVLLRSENLDAEFGDFVSENIERCGFDPKAPRIIKRLAKKPKNTSTRIFSTYQEYYNDELAALVGKRDRLFVDLFDYKFDS